MSKRSTYLNPEASDTSVEHYVTTIENALRNTYLKEILASIRAHLEEAE